MSQFASNKTILLFGLITYGMGQSLLYVIFGPLARDIGLSEVQFGILIAVSNVAIVIFSPIWGRSSEKFGRKPVYLFGLLGYALGYGALALGIQAGLWGWLAPTPLFLLLLGARLVYGSLAAAIQPAATAYVADTTDAGSRGQGMALIAASGGIGTIIGPAFGGLMARFGPLLPMYAAAGLALLAAAVTFVRLAEPVRHANRETPLKLKLTDKRISPYLFGWFITFMVFTAVQIVTPFYIQDRFEVVGRIAITQTAMFALLSMALVTLVVQIGVMQIWKLSPRLLLRTAFFVFGTVLILLAYAQSLWQLYLLYAGMGLSFALSAPGLNAAASLSVNDREQGAVAGLLSAAPAFGMIFGPVLGGLVYRIAPTLPMLAGGAAALLLGVFFWFVPVPDPAKDAALAAGLPRA